MPMRRLFPGVFAVILGTAIVFCIPLFLMLLALSDAIEASPKPLLVMSFLLAGVLAFWVLLSIPRLLRIRRRAKKGRVYSDTYLETAELKSIVTLAFGVFVNLAYAAFKLVAAARYQTLLFAAEAFYYLMLSGVRLLLAFHAFSGRRQGERRLASAWKSYRRCGWELLLLDVAMGFVILQSLRSNTDSVKFAAVVYVSASWAFYRLTAAIVQIIKFRKTDRPLIAASKTINLSAALMSLYILQNTLLLHFGNDELFRQRMNTGFGVAVTLAVILLAAAMIVRGTRQLSKIRASAALQEQIEQELRQEQEPIEV